MTPQSYEEILNQPWAVKIETNEQLLNTYRDALTLPFANPRRSSYFKKLCQDMATLHGDEIARRLSRVPSEEVEAALRSVIYDTRVVPQDVMDCIHAWLPEERPDERMMAIIVRAEQLYSAWIGEPQVDEFKNLPEESRTRWIRLAETDL